MVRKTVLFLSTALVAGSMLIPAYAADKVKVAAIAPVGDLVTEIQAKVTQLNESLANNDNYLKDKKKTIPRNAGVIAVLSQAVLEHDQQSSAKISAADLRDAAIALAKSDSYDAAKTAFGKVKSAAEGNGAGGASKDHAWDKLIDMDSLMTEVNSRNGALRRQMRRITDADAASRDAAVLGVLGLAIAADTHEVKSPGDKPKWEGYSYDLSAQSAKIAEAMRAKNLDASKEAFLAANKSCSACHADFRDN